MAPEQLRGNSRNPTVDLYAVGAILHELIDGRKFRDAVDNEHMYGLVLEGVVPELQHARDVPAELDLLRRRLLEADPAQRIQRAEDALELLMRWPGYRDASVELARLCRAHTGVSAPRSGVHAQARVIATPTGEPTQTAATRRQEASGPVAASSVTAVDIPGAPEASAPTLAAPNASYPIGLVVGLTAVLVGAVGIGGVMLWQGAAAREDPVAAASMETPTPAETPVESATEPEPESATEPEPEAAPPVKLEPAPQPEPEPAPQPEPEDAKAEADAAPASAAKPKAAAPEPATKPKGKAEVTFKTGDFTFVWVKVKGRVLALEPLKKVKLPSGRHRVSFRMSEDEPWKPAGRITIEPDHAYVVRMEKPGRAQIEPL
jgi:hypothetical protein